MLGYKAQCIHHDAQSDKVIPGTYITAHDMMTEFDKNSAGQVQLEIHSGGTSQSAETVSNWKCSEYTKSSWLPHPLKLTKTKPF